MSKHSLVSALRPISSTFALAAVAVFFAGCESFAGGGGPADGTGPVTPETELSLVGAALVADDGAGAVSLCQQRPVGGACRAAFGEVRDAMTLVAPSSAWSDYFWVRDRSEEIANAGVQAATGHQTYGELCDALDAQHDAGCEAHGLVTFVPLSFDLVSDPASGQTSALNLTLEAPIHLAAGDRAPSLGPPRERVYFRPDAGGLRLAVGDRLYSAYALSADDAFAEPVGVCASSDGTAPCGETSVFAARFASSEAIAGLDGDDGCWVSVPECPANPALAGEYRDNVDGASGSEFRCLGRGGRAAELALECGLPATGSVVHAVYVEDGVLRGTLASRNMQGESACFVEIGECPRNPNMANSTRVQTRNAADEDACLSRADVLSAYCALPGAGNFVRASWYERLALNPAIPMVEMSARLSVNVQTCSLQGEGTCPQWFRQESQLEEMPTPVVSDLIREVGFNVLETPAGQCELRSRALARVCHAAVERTVASYGQASTDEAFRAATGADGGAEHCEREYDRAVRSCEATERIRVRSFSVATESPLTLEFGRTSVVHVRVGREAQMACATEVRGRPAMYSAEDPRLVYPDHEEYCETIGYQDVISGGRPITWHDGCGALPPDDGCFVEIDRCANHPEAEYRTIRVNLLGESFDAAVCAARAREYRGWCGDSDLDRHVSTYFVVDGALQSFTSASIPGARCRVRLGLRGRNGWDASYLDYRGTHYPADGQSDEASCHAAARALLEMPGPAPMTIFSFDEDSLSAIASWHDTDGTVLSREQLFPQDGCFIDISEATPAPGYTATGAYLNPLHLRARQRFGGRLARCWVRGEQWARWASSGPGWSSEEEIPGFFRMHREDPSVPGTARVSAHLIRDGRRVGVLEVPVFSSED